MLSEFTSIILCLAHSEKLSSHMVLWDQLRVDKGKEWYLSLFVNEKLSCHRYYTRKLPHLQTSSKKVAKCLCGRDAGN